MVSDYIVNRWVVEVKMRCCWANFAVMSIFGLSHQSLLVDLLLSFERVLLLSTASPPRHRDRCWAAIGMSHRPEPSGHVVRGGVDGLDSGGRHGRRFVLRHTHRPQRRPYLICTSRSGNVQHWCEAVEPDPGSPWEGHSGCVCTGVRNWSAESCGVVCPLCIPLLIRQLRRTYDVVVRKTDDLLCGGNKWVSHFEAPCSCTRWTGEHWVEQVSRLHGTAC